MTTFETPRSRLDPTTDDRLAVTEPLVVHLTGRAGRWLGRATAPRRRRARTALVAASLTAVATTAVGYAIAESGDASGAGEILGPGVVTLEVGIEMSAFDLGTLRVHEGTLVELVVRNDDPIDHELVIGDEEVHRRHAQGVERRHPPVPGEVSVAPGDTGVTFYRFDEPGTVTYACHLPGHVAYGMTGQIEVVPA